MGVLHSAVNMSEMDLSRVCPVEQQAQAPSWTRFSGTVLELQLRTQSLNVQTLTAFRDTVLPRALLMTTIPVVWATLLMFWRTGGDGSVDTDDCWSTDLTNDDFSRPLTGMVTFLLPIYLGKCWDGFQKVLGGVHGINLSLKELWSLLRMQHLAAGKPDAQWSIDPCIDAIRRNLFAAVWIRLAATDQKLSGMVCDAVTGILTADEIKGIDPMNGSHSSVLLHRVYVLYAKGRANNTFVGDEPSVTVAITGLRGHLSSLHEVERDNSGVPFVYSHLMHLIVILYLLEQPFSMYCSWFALPFYTLMAIYTLGCLELANSLMYPCRERSFGCILSRSIIRLDAVIARSEASFLSFVNLKDGLEPGEIDKPT